MHTTGSWKTTTRLSSERITKPAADLRYNLLNNSNFYYFPSNSGPNIFRKREIGQSHQRSCIFILKLKLRGSPERSSHLPEVTQTGGGRGNPCLCSFLATLVLCPSLSLSRYLVSTCHRPDAELKARDTCEQDRSLVPRSQVGRADRHPREVK